MAISHEDCTPFLSATLFRAEDQLDGLAGQLRRAITRALREQFVGSNRLNPPDRVFSTPGDSEFNEGSLDVAWFHYAERRPPPWCADGALRDTSHHIVVVCHKGPLVSISFSDPSARNFVVRSIVKATDGPFNELHRLTGKEIETAFVDGRIRTLWLSGAHRRMLIKPDAKVLSGLELESALDPLEDQSYYFSSVRSTSTNPHLGANGKAAVIGANPLNARIWIGPTRSWGDFASNMDLILDQVADKTAGEIPEGSSIPILAQPTRGLAGVEQPYDMAVIVPELSLAEVATDDDGERWLQQFGDAVRFVIAPIDDGPNFNADVFWGDEELGRLAYVFEERIDRNLHLNIQKIRWKEDAEHQKELLQICSNGDFLTIYFDTGHTFSRGSFYETKFRDAHFEDWRWVNMMHDGTRVGQEKPVDGRRFAVESIGNDDDKSLFGLVARNWPNLEERGHPTGWLVCDDGAMESADFIHFDDTVASPSLTLIHVKGSGSDNIGRGLSVSDYEVVVGQAVKNLRHIDRGLLVEKLNANKTGVLSRAVWHNGQPQQDRDGVLEELSAAGANMEKTIVILQPRVRRSVYDRIRTAMNGNAAPNAEIRRMQQLDTLLLGARADCVALGARLLVIADDDEQ